MKTDKMKEAYNHASLVFYDSSTEKGDAQKMVALLGQSKSISLNEEKNNVFMENIDGKQVAKL